MISSTQAAAALGKLGKGKPKTMSKAAIRQRIDAARKPRSKRHASGSESAKININKDIDNGTVLANTASHEQHI